MLRQTFLHIRGVGEATERAIWEAGVRDWDTFARLSTGVRGMGRARREVVRRALEVSGERLRARDAGYFAKRLRSSEAWRLFTDFRERAAFIDIETTGMGRGSDVTLVGVYAGGKARLFVAGQDLDDLPGALGPYDVYVTYNGACFDVPFLVHRFGERVRPAAQIDLRYVLGAVGLKGGLKGVERQLGISRPDDLGGLDGWDAVRLWHEYESGRVESLRTLARYNVEDILNLEPLLDAAINLHIDKRRLPFARVLFGSTPRSRARAGAAAVASLGRSTGLW